MDCDQSAQHLELDSEHSYHHTALCRRNTRKEIDNTHSYASLPATQAASESSVLI